MPKRLRLTAWKSELAEINAKARQEGMREYEIEGCRQADRGNEELGNPGSYVWS